MDLYGTQHHTRRPSRRVGIAAGVRVELNFVVQLYRRMLKELDSQTPLKTCTSATVINMTEPSVVYCFFFFKPSFHDKNRTYDRAIPIGATASLAATSLAMQLEYHTNRRNITMYHVTNTTIASKSHPFPTPYKIRYSPCHRCLFRCPFPSTETAS